MHPQTYKSLANARDFMRHAYQRPINLPDISAQANLSPYHFLRVHKSTYGETPHEFPCPGSLKVVSRCAADQSFREGL